MGCAARVVLCVMCLLETDNVWDTGVRLATAIVSYVGACDMGAITGAWPAWGAAHLRWGSGEVMRSLDDLGLQTASLVMGGDRADMTRLPEAAASIVVWLTHMALDIVSRPLAKALLPGHVVMGRGETLTTQRLGIEDGLRPAPRWAEVAGWAIGWASTRAARTTVRMVVWTLLQLCGHTLILSWHYLPTSAPSLGTCIRLHHWQ